MPDLQTITVQPSGLETHYYRAGNGPPLLYLHHMLGMVGWEPALDELSQSFDVIAPFHPGWGPAKDQLPEVATNLDIVLHYVDFLDALGLDAVHIAGISIGAWMAAEFAAIVPGRVQRLVLVNPIGIWDEQAQGVDPFAQSPARPTAVLFSRPELRASLLIGDRDPMEAGISELLDLRAAAKFMWPIPDKGIAQRLPRIKAPTLVVTSERDSVVLAPLGEQWRAGIAGAKLTTLPAAGHLAELEQPAAFAALVRAWVAEGKIAQPQVAAATA
ncbi:MAG: alpha/beta hydrolase [Chloroflexi bacterium]|nr:alpha/beta hydrolase [Chloroflexota bacterium]